MALNELVVQLREGLEPLKAAEARRSWQQALGAAVPDLSPRLGEPFARAESFHAVREAMGSASERARGRLRSLLALCASEHEARGAAAAQEARERLATQPLAEDAPGLTLALAVHAIEREPHRERRVALSRALANAHRSLSSPGRQQLELAARSAESLGAAGPLALRDEVAGIAHLRWAEGAEAFERDTRGAFHELLAYGLGRTTQGVRPAPRGEAEAHDVHHAARAPWLDGLLPREDLLPALQHWTESIGFGWKAGGRIRVALDEGPRELPPMAVGLAIPGDIRLAVRRERGLEGWRALLGAVATAQSLAHADPGSPPEDRRLGDPAVRALWPQLFELLLLEPRWLMRYARVTGNQARELVRFAAFAQLLRLRTRAASHGFNAWVLSRGSTAGLEEAWVERARHALQAEASASSAWVALDPSLHAVHDLRAAALVEPLRLMLQERYDEDWWRNPAGGHFLKSLFARGGRDSVEQLATELGCATLSLQPVAARLLRTMEG